MEICGRINNNNNLIYKAPYIKNLLLFRGAW